MSAILALIATVAAWQPTGTKGHDATLTVKVDSSRHEVAITASSFDLMNMPPMASHAMMDMGASHDTPVLTFAWPVDGWFRGFKVEVLDADGNQLPRHIMHHMIFINYDRRQLVYPAAERLFGAGTETDDASVPASIGVPLRKGANLGFYIAWHNDTGKDLAGVRLRLTMQYLPTNQNPRPLDVLPVYMDVNLTVGGTNTFDVEPGKSTKAYEFTVPVGGRLIAYGGHMHDYGIMVRLEDVESGKELAKVTATRDAHGTVTKVSRNLPGIKGAGIKLKPDHKYRVIAYYDNPTGEVIKNGAMASIVGLFAPDDMKQWPQIDDADPMFQKDLASLEILGTGGDGMEGMEHDHN